jgi:hypothetical protein
MSATGSPKAVCDVQHNTSRTDKGDLPIAPDLTDDISGLHNNLSLSGVVLTCHCADLRQFA